MDYYKIYLKTCTKFYETSEESIKKELQKGLDSSLAFDAIFDDISKNLYCSKNELRSVLERYKLLEASNNFNTWENRYTSEKSIELVVKNELYSFFQNKAHENELKIDFREFLELFGKYNTAEDTIYYFYDNKADIKAIYEAQKVASFNLNPTEILKAKTNWQSNISKNSELPCNDIPEMCSTEEIFWKSKIEGFTIDEKIVLLYLYYQQRERVKQPEFLKLIMIVGGIFDITIFQNDYRNGKLYKNLSNGPDYFKIERKRELLISLKKKLIPFKMAVIQTKLDSEMIYSQ
jgi:hypothetical protein